MSYSLARSVQRVVFSLPVAAVLAAACSDGTTAPVVNTTTPVDTIVTPPSSSSSASSASALAGARLYVDPSSNARRTADQWRATRPADAAQLDKIAVQPQARWFGDWNTNIWADVDAATTAMTSAGAVPVFVAYNIPQRDCGGLSGGNQVSVASYKQWISGFAAGIGARRAAVILEPDALANMDCLSPADQQTRLSLFAYAIAAFKALPATSVYIDAGHAKWQAVSVMASRLTAAGVADAAGFALNVSNFVSDADNIAYGQKLSSLIDGKHFIIDSGRNGLGPTSNNEWCNPTGRALGTRPTTNTGVAGLDAFLWIKTPGESDGACNGAPAAGQWWADYALGLAQRAAF
jgi:endoglucanase